MKRRIVAVLALAALALPAAAAPAQEPAAVRTERIEVPVGDGTILRATLRMPAGDVRPRPTVVEITPYSGAQGLGRDGGLLLDLARDGYTTLLLDVRGTGTSNGDYCFLCAREIQDGADAIEWLAGQPFSDGRVGLVGYSYSAIVAARTAALRPPHLAAIAAGSTYNDAYRDVLFPGGLLSADAAVLGVLFTGIPLSRINKDAGVEEWLPALRDGLGRRTTVLQQALAHPNHDGFWRERSLEEAARRIEVPALFLTGWHDLYARGTPRTFRGAGSQEKALIVSGQGHLADQGPFERAAARWFDTHLRTRPGPARSLAAAPLPRVLLADQRGGWRRFERWLPEHETRTLNLCPPGALQAAACERSGSATVPAVPVDLTAGFSISHDAGGDPALYDALDQRLAPFAAAFVGQPLERDTTITGPLTVRFSARTLGTDADWTARVVDVAPDGARDLVGRGWLKASHRREDPAQPDLFHTHDNPQRLVAGRLYDLAVEVWPTSYVVPEGHRLGVLLTAADTQKVLPSGESAASEVVISPQRPARLTVPVRTEPGAAERDIAAAYAPAPAPPATDAEPCRPAIARAVARSDGRVRFGRSETAVAEIRSRDGRLLLRRTVRSGEPAWDGREADDAPAPDGLYQVSLLAPAGDGITHRRLTFRRRDGRLRPGPRIEREPTCGLLRTARLAGPEFERAVELRYELGRRARVTAELRRAGRLLRRVTRTAAAGKHRLVLPARGTRRGEHQVRLAVRGRRGFTVRATLAAVRR